MKMGLAGYFNTRIWTGVLDPIEVRCCVMKQADITAVIVQFELITVTPELQQAVRSVTQKHLGDFDLHQRNNFFRLLPHKVEGKISGFDHHRHGRLYHRSNYDYLVEVYV